MQESIDNQLRETQYGFRSGRGTIDAIFIVRQLIEKANERNIPLKKLPLHRLQGCFRYSLEESTLENVKINWR